MGQQADRTQRHTSTHHQQRHEGGAAVVLIATALLGPDGQLRRKLAADCVVVECPAEKKAALERCRHFAPCVLIADEAFFGRLDAEEAAALNDSCSGVRTIVVTSADQRQRVALLRLGCSGFLEETCPVAEIRRAVLAVAGGDMWVSHDLLVATLREVTSELRMPRLTPREHEVLTLIESGLRNREIAERLCIAYETVRWHIRAMHAKLGPRPSPAPSRWAAPTWGS